MKRLLLSSLMILASALVFAQSATMMTMARAELEKRGLTETEVRERLLQEGINVDAISPSDYVQYQTKVINILNRMQEEKEKGIVPTPDPNSLDVPAEAVNVPQTTPEEEAAEATLPTPVAEDTSNVYGHSMFQSQTPEVFRTTDGAQAPDSYVIGEGDEVHISIFGSSQTEIHQRIGPDGSIQPAGATKIFLKGLTLAQGRAAVRSKLSQHYSFRPDQIAVTITTARTVTVGVYGEVGTQGGFTMSALNNAFNAISLAGGLKSTGSLRNIQRSRGGKSDVLDFYKYMTNPTVGVPYDIQNGDVIFVPIAQNIVTVEGAVNRPMNYEMTDGEDILALITYAGGLRYDAYPEFVQVERHENGEISFQDYKLSEVISGAQKVTLRPGDIVRIKEVVKPLEKFVEINGDVYYGGRFDAEKNQSLRALIEKAEPKPTSRKDYVVIQRTYKDDTVEVLNVPYPGEAGNPDFSLIEKDIVTVLEAANFRDTLRVTVNGMVRRPFYRDFGLNDRITVGQALDLAGGPLPSVYPVAYIFRKDITNPDKREYIRVSLENDREKPLQPGDSLNVYDNSTYTNIGEVRISGAVKDPVGVAYDSSLTLRDLILMAGGFEVGASFNRIEVFRVKLADNDEVHYNRATLAVDKDYNPLDKSFQLQPFDQIVVRMTPDFTTDRTVEINGRVKYPGVYALPDNRTQLSEIIALAGGLLDDADPYATVIRTKGHNMGRISINLKDMKKRRGHIDMDPILLKDDVINVYRQENTVVIRSLGTRMNQYTPADFSSEQKTVVYQGPRRAAWYINNFAGGYDKYANRNSVTVTLPNNQTMATRRFIFRATPKVLPGSVITLQMDQDKIDNRARKIAEPKERADIESIAAKTLSSVTSIVSIIILSRNLINTSK